MLYEIPAGLDSTAASLIVYKDEDMGSKHEASGVIVIVTV